MRNFKIVALAAAAVATLGASASMAHPGPHRGHKPHKICKVERHHGHAKKVCRWVR